MAVIPARYASSRFPGKPLALICGKPMVGHVWERTRQAKGVDRVIVATDDDRIAAYCSSAGIDCEMTSAKHETGTDRLAEVAQRCDADIFVNVQGDEPLIDPASVDACVDCIVGALQRGIEVATAYIEGATEDQERSASAVQLVPTLDRCVMAFSRLPIPCAFREPYRRNVHVGLCAFTRAALGRFGAWERGPVERAESIELLRFIEHGERIACCPVADGSIAVDHPEDVQLVERSIRQRQRTTP